MPSSVPWACGAVRAESKLRLIAIAPILGGGTCPLLRQKPCGHTPNIGESRLIMLVSPVSRNPLPVSEHGIAGRLLEGQGRVEGQEA